MSESRIALSLNGEQSSLPPMLQSYLEFKRLYPDCLILFQVGDFYEVFFEDASVVAKTLNITLTSRDKASAEPIPMCGVPISVADIYSERLVVAGYSVALVSQKEVGPSHKGPVPRALERIVTPGVRILGAEPLEAAEPIVASVFPIPDGEEFGLVSCTAQSGRAKASECLGSSELIRELSRLSPSEIIIPSDLDGTNIDKRTSWVREISERIPSAKLKFRVPRRVEKVLSSVPGYPGLGISSRKAFRLLSEYIDEVTVESGFRFCEVRSSSEGKTVLIDASTRDNLELVKELRGGAKAKSLWGTLDTCQTVGGSRLTRSWIISPSCDLAEIRQRHTSVNVLIQSSKHREVLRRLLSFVPDLERIATRIDLKVVSPVELSSLREALLSLPDIKHVASTLGEKSELLSSCSEKIIIPEKLLDTLQKALADSPSNIFTEGEVIRDGYDEELDRLRTIRRHGREWISALEAKEKEITGISSLKLRYNQGFGFFIEISKANLHKVPAHYRRKQTTVNGERFTTEELSLREHEIRTAETSELRRQKEIFYELREMMLPHVTTLRILGEALSCLDALASFSEVASLRGYIQPEMLSEPILHIEKGKHPVLSLQLGSSFVPNEINLDGEDTRCLIVTGPNMGGKSTYLRQAALITIMAHAGSFVPAKSAQIGIVDQVFARIGAADNPSEGDSTFMVEMREVSHILREATSSSLLLIDEVGRGTATTDGLALARACLEAIIVSIRCRTFFATHFHELTDLAQSYGGVINVSVGSVVEDGALVFTHKIEPGPANRSYGLEVARRAGVPQDTINRAAILLETILKTREDAASKSSQLPLFIASAPAPKEDTNLGALKEKILSVQVDEITPLQALNILSSLRAMVTK